MQFLSLCLVSMWLVHVQSFAPPRLGAPRIRANHHLLAATDGVDTEEPPPHHVVVVGGGWGGWGACKSLLEAGCKVTLIDALPDPSGATPYLSSTGKPVEPGTRGFWKDYPNIEAMLAELGLDADAEVFTPFTNSSFYSPDGLEATAPVFSTATVSLPPLPFGLEAPKSTADLPFGMGGLLEQLPGLSGLSSGGGGIPLPAFGEANTFPTLPSPLGQILATFPLFERLPLADRASMAGLLLATLDCLGHEQTPGGAEVQAAYDRMSAHELFLRFGLSDRLVEDFIRPTLLVGLFKPPEELSALVVMELLYYYALAHQDSFDVRWVRRGTVATSLQAPLAASLLEKHDLTVLGGCAVTAVEEEAVTEAVQAAAEEGKDEEVGVAAAAAAAAAASTVKAAVSAPQQRAGRVTYKRVAAASVAPKGGSGSGSVGGGGRLAVGEEGAVEGVDGVVLAVGAKGMASIVRGSPLLSQHAPLAAAGSLGGVDVVSVRLWLDATVPTRTPANVFSRFPSLRGAGGTFFMLDQLQVKSARDEAELWGEGEAFPEAGSDEEAAAEAAWAAEPRGRLGSVVACDFYNAGGLLGLGEGELVDLLLDDLLPAAVPAFQGAQAVDAWVGKYPGAVSWFSPGSFTKRPKLHGAGRGVLPNVKCAGDWVVLGDREHGAKGLCQERAFVTGLEAGNALLDELKQQPQQQRAKVGPKHAVIPVRPAEPQVVAGMAAARAFLNPTRRFWVR